MVRRWPHLLPSPSWPATCEFADQVTQDLHARLDGGNREIGIYQVNLLHELECRARTYCGRRVAENFRDIEGGV